MQMYTPVNNGGEVTVLALSLVRGKNISNRLSSDNSKRIFVAVAKVRIPGE